MDRFLRQRLTFYLPGAGALLVAAGVAAAVALAPTAMLEDAARSTPLASVIPIDSAARLPMALVAALVAGAVAWSVLFFLWGRGGLLVPRYVRGDGTLAVRRADAHPDAPPRRPFSMAEVEALAPRRATPIERDLPRDLSEPLATYDPHAILPVPREPVRPVSPLTPPPPAVPAATARADSRPADRFPVETGVSVVTGTEPSIGALLRRLERGAARRAARA